MPRSPYSSPYARLVANVTEHNGCWCGTDRTACRFGYQQINWWVPGLGRRVKLMAHLCTWLWIEAGCTTVDELYLAYCELRASGLQLDHECVETSCRNPDHLEAVTQAVNIQRRHARRSPRQAAPEPCDMEF
jgi:hypothetical protein